MKKLFLFFILILNLAANESKIQISYSSPFTLSGEQDVGVNETDILINKTNHFFTLFAQYKYKSFLDSYKEHLLDSYLGFSFFSSFYFLAGIHYNNFYLADVNINEKKYDYSFGGLYLHKVFQFQFLKSKNNLESNLRFFGYRKQSVEFEVSIKKSQENKSIQSKVIYRFFQNYSMSFGWHYYTKEISFENKFYIQNKFQLGLEYVIPTSQNYGNQIKFSLTYHFQEKSNNPYFIKKNNYSKKTFLLKRSLHKPNPKLDSYRNFFNEEKYELAKNSISKENKLKQMSYRLLSSNYKRKNKKLSLPNFSTLIHWGLSPMQAYKLLKTKNVCKLNLKSQKILKIKNLFCSKTKI